MTLLIYCYVILFISLLINTSLMHFEHKNSCITFETNKKDYVNQCKDHISLNEKNVITLSCSIEDAVRMKTDRCPMNYRHRHITLNFFNNFIFEAFFKANHKVIKNLFQKKNLTDKISLDITINNHNLTKITWAYINSVLKIDSKVYTNLRLFFEQTNQNASQPEIGDDFHHDNLPFIQLHIRCNDHIEKNYDSLENESTKVLKFNHCMSFCSSYLLRNLENINIKGKNKTHHTAATAKRITNKRRVTATKTSTSASNTTIKTAEPGISPKLMTKRTSITKEKFTTKLIDNVPRSVSDVVFISTSKLSELRSTTTLTRMKVTPVGITAQTLNISLSSTESSRKSSILVFLYFLPSLLILLTCVILITIHIILRYRRQHNQPDIIVQDFSVRSSITSETLTFR
jgi:hypothetical protein